MVQTSSLQVHPISGTLQISKAGQSFQPIAVRVTDSSTSPNPVMGASVGFLTYIGRMPGNEPIIWSGETNISQPVMPVILAESQNMVQSDVNGLASNSISTGGIAGNAVVLGTASAGNSSVEYEAQALGP
jgi:hypothetical protein